jgi:glutamate synthase (NADPH/NADH) large chain
VKGIKKDDAYGMKKAIDVLRQDAHKAVKDGYNILILSDRNQSKDRIAIPALLATSATHQHLVREGLRTNTGLVVDTGSAREVHHFALLGGYGAEAICPWLAYESMNAMTSDHELAKKNFIKSISKGLYKVMSKMGISTYQSYCGAQIFEAVGLNSQLINAYFKGTATNVEGIGIEEIAEETMRIHQSAFGSDPVLAHALDAGGEYAFRIRGEEHMWTPDSIAKLQHATRTNQYNTYKEYAALINDQTKRQMTFRGLFKLKTNDKAIPLDEVESAKEIVKRFATGAMSLGSISTEAHTTLAIAMNRIGGKSNTGEGGEDAKRFLTLDKDNTVANVIGLNLIESDIKLKKGDSLRSRIKQVASGRFGVTAEYLSSADQIQIKMAQGAKPGEGGQLPGHKVSPYIAKLRFSVPGVGLISPPPHHDIYSIEDLAQLIHDLKNANPSASISVKLVSETGVGTVAAGVAKAKSDHIVIAGHDGGTGASPISSIKHAGTPWEIGLAETQQTLVLNRLRGRVIVQVDGQMKTGRDVVIGALLGADEFGFATAPLVVEGCIMMRKCHLNTCPVGVATQDPELRKRFTGQPEHVVNYFFFVAEEVRELMASLGVRKFDDLIGRSDLLDTQAGIEHWKIHGLDFSKIFYQPAIEKEVSRRHNEEQSHGLEHALDNELIKLAKPALEKREKLSINLPIVNTNRTVGTMLSHEIAKRFGHEGLPQDTIQITLNGTAGQSFAAFLAQGISMELIGEGNDYVAKGLCGGRVVIKPPKAFKAKSHEIAKRFGHEGLPQDTIQITLNGTAGQSFAAFLAQGISMELIGEGNDYVAKGLCGGRVVIKPPKAFKAKSHENIIVGNTVMYGATTGESYFSGVAGERFCVRNSGASAVVEGVGNHGCEYMTGGTVVVLGNTGQNFAAGMSGGVAYVYDEDGLFNKRCNPSMVSLEKVETKEAQAKVPQHLNQPDEVILKTLIEKHFKYTNSERAKFIIDNWDKARTQFIKVMPNEYKRALNELHASLTKEAA